ncbi:TetR/AcrR family transcriptional regulator [Rhodococcus sp. NBC_00294]|uniref:TetR/AcrR family transcriptional regulator n=1 Tax=Rhodococcus sp. NBC_00294 TaxID=2976004 RepID=UPI002E2D0F50|nr:helix-turn-helix domain-containing protein [Rhodococcus sp. NBC_00294]
MSSSPAMSRRERNKQDKLDRITTAARDLFAEYGVSEVTTQQVADHADVGTGTVFLYAKNKGELLLLVQNSDYASALERGIAAAAHVVDPVEAVMAVLRPVVECNRKQIENGRTYQREVVFGDDTEPHRREALSLAARTEAVVAEILGRDDDDATHHPDRQVQAHIVSAILFLSMALTANATKSVADVATEIEMQIGVLLGR